MNCKNLKCSTILVNLNSAVTITTASNLLILNVHDKYGYKHPNDNSEEGSSADEKIDDEPYFKSDHHSSTDHVEDSDCQQPTLQLHYY